MLTRKNFQRPVCFESGIKISVIYLTFLTSTVTYKHYKMILQKDPLACLFALHSLSLCCTLICVSLWTPTLKSHPQHGSVCKRGLWRGRWSCPNRDQCPAAKTWERSLSPLAAWGTQHFYNLEGGLLPDRTSSLMMDLQASRAMKNKFLELMH